MPINIVNIPENVNDYQYLVIARAFGMEDTFFFYGGFNDREDAELLASHVAGFVIYNVEFQFDWGEPEEEPENTYSVSGYWYYDVKAKNLEEAKQKFREIISEDNLNDEFFDNVEIDFDGLDWEKQ